MSRGRKTSTAKTSRNKPVKIKASKRSKQSTRKRDPESAQNVSKMQSSKNKPKPKVAQRKPTQNLKQLSPKRASKMTHGQESMTTPKALVKPKQLSQGPSKAFQKLFGNNIALLTSKATHRLYPFSQKMNLMTAQRMLAGVNTSLTSRALRSKSTGEPRVIPPLSNLPQAVASQQVFYHAVLRSVAGCSESGATREEVSRTVSSMLGVCPVVMEPIVGAALSHAAVGKLIESNHGRFVPKYPEQLRALPIAENSIPAPGEVCTLDDIMDRTDDWLHIFKECALLTRNEVTCF
nr:PREDICTED: uncharacterized protein LOC109030303 [Bemisia tabaci]